MGSFIDKKGIDKKVRHILADYTLFTKEEIDIKSSTKEEFLAFYYENEHKINYSDIIGAFILSPIEQRESQYELQSIDSPTKSDQSVLIREAIHKYNSALQKKDSKNLIKHIESLAQLDNEQVYNFLINELENGPFSKTAMPNKNAVTLALAQSLENYTTLETVEIILKKLELKELNINEIHSTLSKLTNIFSDTNLDNNETVDFYIQLIDSLGTIDALRTYGYEKIFNFKANFFYEKVDYYGKILCLSNSHPWVTHNAYQDILRTEHPRMLYYLAALIYKNRKNDSRIDIETYQQYLEDLTQVRIGILNNNQKADFSLDRKKLEQFLYYWSKHYDDYEWETHQGGFINKMELTERTENYEKLFRRLNSKNDTVAWASYVQLTEGDPLQIMELSRKYKPLLRNYNKSLPSSKHQYLERLVVLTDFCRQNNIKYQPSSEINALLDELSLAANRSSRYLIENKIIASLSLRDLTALEYWGCLNSKMKDNALSLGRILDCFYSKNWEYIINDADQLRLYLKKADLFSTIGATGICNAYLNKFNINDNAEQFQLKELQKSETDEGILRQISQVLVSTENEAQQALSFEDFLANPQSYNKIEIKILPAPNASKLKLVSRAIKNLEDIEAIKKLFFYLSNHQSIEMVPHLFDLIDEQKILVKSTDYTLTVGDRTVPILEDIYDHSFASKEDKRIFTTDAWRKLWKADKRNYKNWRKQFFGYQIKRLQEQEALTIDDLNNLLESPDYDESYKPTCLELLAKVKPAKNIRKLNIMPKLSVETDLVYFENFSLTHKQLDDIPKLFEVDNPSKMIAFLDEKSTDFDVTDKGAFYNNLFQASWFSEHIFDANIDHQMAKKISNILTDYLNESDYVSEFEEQRTLLNIAQINNIGLSLNEQLEATLNMDADEASKAKIQEAIIARISYAELGDIADYIEFLSVPRGQRPYDFLHKDFGLPIFDLEDPADRLTFATKHKQESEFDFYKYYLKTFGVDFLDEKNELDFNKIYDILSFDIVSPFVGAGGGKRDDYVYGIIKLLEIYFDTRLDFHEKLNEAQSFYTYTSSKRAKTWKAYLEKKNLHNERKKLPPSFNQVRVGN